MNKFNVGANLSEPTKKNCVAIQLALNPKVNCVCITLRSSMLNCLYFSMQYFLSKNVALQI